MWRARVSKYLDASGDAFISDDSRPSPGEAVEISVRNGQIIGHFAYLLEAALTRLGRHISLPFSSYTHMGTEESLRRRFYMKKTVNDQPHEYLRLAEVDRHDNIISCALSEA